MPMRSVAAKDIEDEGALAARAQSIAIHVSFTRLLTRGVKDMTGEGLVDAMRHARPSRRRAGPSLDRATASSDS